MDKVSFNLIIKPLGGIPIDTKNKKKGETCPICLNFSGKIKNLQWV